MLVGRYPIQRDLDGLEEWSHVSLMKFNKPKGKVIHLGRGSPQYQYKLGISALKVASWEGLSDISG